ncbi:MAG TPA: cyclic peptide export ABC transporter [Thermoanaerobaculia bacterium]|nr:cyclic peptide export ABC transporter [Thermoanaerobaculia bacterium]
MDLLRFLLRESRATVAFAILVGLLSGAGNSGLMIFINSRLIHGHPVGSSLAWGFAGLCLAVIVTRTTSNLLLLRLGERSVRGLRLRLSHRILAAPLRHLEELGPHRLLATLTGDIPAITNAVILLPEISISASIVAGCLAYLGWLSLPAFGITLVFIMAGAGGYHLAIRSALRHFKLAREQNDELLSHFRSLTEGTKELKIHRERRQSFLSVVLGSTVERVYDAGVRGGSLYALAESWGHLMIFVLLGLLAFLLPFLTRIDDRTLTGYTFCLLYIVLPLQVVLNSLPIFGRAQVALGRIRQMDLDLDAQPADEGNAPMGKGPSWHRLELIDVSHSSRREGVEGHFTVGPLGLELAPGEILFLVGGNGSGKTTLAKILAGLYAPKSGEIRLDGEPVSAANVDAYRQYFSAIFSDFYLFPSLLGIEPARRAEAGTYLAQLQLSHKVVVEENGFLSTTELSQGQRKRLALLTAYLENRPIYLFDEWAADQDPVFREIFYRQILPSLKARGKAVIVISHDDRYYDIGDRLIKLDYGRIVFDGAPHLLIESVA